MLTVSTHLSLSDDFATFKRMLSSASFADNILIFAYKGVPQTHLSELKRNPKVKIISIEPVPLVEHIRTRQIQEAKGDWVLILDFDEIVSPQLAQEIRKIVSQDSHCPSTYYLRRRNFSLGYPLNHGGWGDDSILRLFYSKDFLDWPHSIHSTPTYCGETGRLFGVLEHHKDATLSYMVRKTNLYSDAEAKLFLDGGMAPVTRLTLVRKPIMEFLRRYYFKLGFLDGAIGLIQALYQSYSVFLTYAKLYELQAQSAINHKK